jgi:hypothetical protein|tara:strand:+ start:214 stop:462 length:249 start_codon:yes stop_codon:yes gene_type:complete
MTSIAIVFALLMFNSQGDPSDWKTSEEFMYTDNLSSCMKLRREATRNTNGKVTFKCIQAEVELEILEVDKSLHINKIIREVK